MANCVCMYDRLLCLTELSVVKKNLVRFISWVFEKCWISRKRWVKLKFTTNSIISNNARRYKNMGLVLQVVNCAFCVWNSAAFGLQTYHKLELELKRVGIKGVFIVSQIIMNFSTLFWKLKFKNFSVIFGVENFRIWDKIWKQSDNTSSSSNISVCVSNKTINF